MSGKSVHIIKSIQVCVTFVLLWLIWQKWRKGGIMEVGSWFQRISPKAIIGEGIVGFQINSWPRSLWQRLVKWCWPWSQQLDRGKGVRKDWKMCSQKHNSTLSVRSHIPSFLKRTLLAENQGLKTWSHEEDIWDSSHHTTQTLRYSSYLHCLLGWFMVVHTLTDL